MITGKSCSDAVVAGHWHPKALGACVGLFLLLTCQSSSHGHGLCVLVFPFQQSHLHCLTLLLDLELSFSLTHTMGMGSFGKGLSLMWDTHPHPALESCTHRSFSHRIPEQEKDCGPFPRTVAHFHGLWPISQPRAPVLHRVWCC